MDLKVQGRFIFFPEFLVRTQLIKIRGRQATPRQNREAKQIAVQSMRFSPKGSPICNWLKPKQLRLFLSVSCSPSSIKM